MILEKGNAILDKVKTYIDKYLDPKKINIFDSSKDDYIKLPDIVHILSDLWISEEDYYESLQISSDIDF